jgi:hypothetical protein
MRSATPDASATTSWFRSGCVVVIAAASVVCVAAALLGHRRMGDVTFYLYDLKDSGHPGLVTVVAAIGLAGTAIASFVLALSWGSSHQSERTAWLIAAVALGLLAADTLVRLHNRLAAIDALVHVVLWVASVWIARRLLPAVRGRQGSAVVLCGLVLLAELVDLYPSGDVRSFRFFSAFQIVEESSASIGACTLAIGLAGFAGGQLVRASQDDAL